MEVLELNSTARERTGTRAARRARREGMIPCILYGLDKDAISLNLTRTDIDSMLRSGRKMVGLKVGTSSESAVVKSMQFHPVTDDIIHVDFERVALDEELTIEVAITFKGRAKGVEDHGVLDHVMHSIEVTCLPTNIPDEILLDVTELTIGDSSHVSDLMMPEGVKPVPDPEEIVAVVHPPAAEEGEAAPEEEGAAEPEVITAAERAEEGSSEEPGKDGAPGKSE